ncbi:MAG: TolC family protein [Bacteroidetes bacterium]|jgi:outer membrane protein TolC|nr:TolC family protein [Bacteroidota bacterium]
MKKMLLFIVLIAPCLFAQQNTLQDYVEQGLESNLVIKQKQHSLKKSMWALKEARGMFFPNVSFQARYSVAQGGREIDFPVGDLLNPVYNSLNQLTGEQRFSNIPNEAIPFLRPTEQETKFRVTQSIVNPQIHFNRKINEEAYQITEQELEQYKRELEADIKKAYFDYLKTLNVLSLLEETEKLVEENLRVSQKLYDNDMITEDAVWRAKTEVSELTGRMAEAEKNHHLARSYFNFLLNRELSMPIEIEKFEFMPGLQEASFYMQQALDQREELKIIEHQLLLNRYSVKMSKSSFYPTLSAAVEAGIQGEDYRIDENADFVMASVVLSWDLFTGGQNKARKMQAELQHQSVDLARQRLQQQIRLQVQENYDRSTEKIKRFEASQVNEKHAQKAYEITRKRYSLGTASQIELIDARNTMTNASVNRIISKYDFYISLVKLEQTTSTSIIY